MRGKILYMMDKNNYYEWLELPVEEFESDITKIERIFNEKIKNWNQSPNINIQQRAGVHKDKIKEAYNDTAEWKRLYDEYKNRINLEIEKTLEFVADDMVVLEENIGKIAAKHKVTEDYVHAIAKAKGYDGKEGKKTTTSKTKKTLDSIKPVFLNKLKPIQDTINKLGFDDISDLIHDQLGIDIAIEGPGADKDKIAEAIKEIKKIWAKVSPNNNKKFQAKSLYDKACGGAIKFFEEYSLEDYCAYIRYESVYSILLELNSDAKSYNRSNLNDEAFDTTVKKIYEVLGERDTARDILEAYCDKNEIGYSKPIAKVAICPFCASRFEKSNPIQNECPSCRKSFFIKCPKCNNDKNLLIVSSCDGVNLQKYPLYSGMIEDANKEYLRMRFNYVKDKIKEINEVWTNFPGTEQLFKKCEDAEKKYGDKIKRIQIYKNNGQYFSAIKICDELAEEFPQCHNTYKDIYETVQSAKRIFDEYKNEKNPDNKLNMLMQLVEEVSDYSEANIELKKYPLEKVYDLKTTINRETGKVNISWKSANKPGSVMYHVIRKKGSIPANADDGKELIITNGESYADECVEEGIAYYYGVYAQRGTEKSFVACSGEPMLFLESVKPSVVGKNSSIDVSWEQVSCGQVKVAYATSPINSTNIGSFCSNVSGAGCCIQSLDNGTTYYLAVWKEITVDEITYKSDVTTVTAQPIEPIEPPIFSREFGRESGEFILNHENFKRGEIITFYCSDSLVGVKENDSMNLTDLTSKVKPLIVNKIEACKYSMNLDGKKDLYVYPVIVRGITATVGNILSLKFANPISIIDSVAGAGKLTLRLSEWPTGASALIVCYNSDSYPGDVKDCDVKLPAVSKSQFEADRCITIKDIGNQKYYISIFARIEADYLPVCNYYFDAAPDVVIKYEFSASLFGIKVKLYSENGTHPEIEIRRKKGSMPIRNSEGESVQIIKANNTCSTKQEYEIKERAEKETYYKLFTREKGYTLMPIGNLCLKK